MAYGLQYHFSFLEIDLPELGHGVPRRYRVRFLRDGYTGVATEILPGQDPVRVKWDRKDSLLTPIAPSTVTISLAAQAYWKVEGLFLTKKRQVQVVIDVDYTGTGDSYQATPFWIGWLRSQNLSEKYQAKPYPVKVEAWDGLTEIDKKSLIDSAGKRLTGQLSLSQTLRIALLRTGHNLALKSGINLYETAEIATGQTVASRANPATDPLCKAQVLAEAFVTDSGTATPSGTAVAAINAPHASTLAQVNGTWLTVPAHHAAGGYDGTAGGTTTTLPIRTFAPITSQLTGPGAPQSAPQSWESVDLSVTVSRTGKVRAQDGDTILQGIKPGIRVDQQFGRFLNKLKNGNFLQVDGSNMPIDWKRQGGAGADSIYRVGTGTDTDPYALYIKGAVEGLDFYGPAVQYGAIQLVEYSPDSPDFNQAYKRTLKFDFTIGNAKAGNIVVFAITGSKPTGSNTVKIDPGYVLLQQSGAWKRNPSAKERKTGTIPYNHYVEDTTQNPKKQVPKPGVCNVTQQMDALQGVLLIGYMFLPAIGRDIFDSTGKIVGWDQGSAQNPAFIKYSNATVEVERAGNTLNGTQITISPDPDPVESDATITLGDVPDAAYPHDRIGTLYKQQAGLVPTTRWYHPQANILTDYALGNTLLGWLAFRYACQYLQPSYSWEGTLTGRLPHAIHTVLRYADIGEESGGVVIDPYAFGLVNLDMGLRMCDNRTTAHQIMPTAPAGMPRKRYWLTPDGEYLAAEDPNENLIAPSLSAEESIVDIARRIAEEVAKQNGGTANPALDGHVYDPQSGLPIVETYTNGQLRNVFPMTFRKLIDIAQLIQDAVNAGGGGGG